MQMPAGGRSRRHLRQGQQERLGAAAALHPSRRTGPARCAADTVLLFTKDELHALAGSKKTEILQQVADACKAAGVTLVLHPKPRKEDGAAQMDALLAAARGSAGSPVVGVLPKVRGGAQQVELCTTGETGATAARRLQRVAHDGIACMPPKRRRIPANPPGRPAPAPQEKPEGPFAALWLQSLAESGLATVDVAAVLADVMAVKDEDEVKNIKKAAFLAGSTINQFAVTQIEGACVRSVHTAQGVCA